MSNSLIKSYNVNYAARNEEKKKRVIDSNQAVSDRIKALSEILEKAEDEDVASDFNEGLDAAQVDALLSDPDDIPPEVTAGNEKAQKIVEEAEEQARQIIDDANEQAAKIVADANEQAQGVLEEARSKGEEEGRNKGYEEGMEQAKEAERQAEEKVAAIAAQYEEMEASLEPKMVEALTGIYSHVLGIDLSGRNDVVLYLLKDAIRNSEGSKNFLVHVSKEDHEYVLENRDELSAGLGGSAVVEIIEDMTLTAGNCFVETDGGIYDCSLGTELELLAKELKILAYS